jgi:hypothetical protein
MPSPAGAPECSPARKRWDPGHGIRQPRFGAQEMRMSTESESPTLAIEMKQPSNRPGSTSLLTLSTRPEVLRLWRGVRKMPPSYYQL